MHTTRMIGRIARFIQDRRGVSAVEFAFIAPVMITLYLGLTEISDGVAVKRKISLTAGALSNLAAQIATISSTQMTNIFDASTAIINPYAASRLQMTVTCLKIDTNGIARVQWSAARNTTSPYSPGATYTFSSTTAPLAVPSSWLILSEVNYLYTPIVGYYLTGDIPLSDKMFMSPRISPPTYAGTTCT